MSGDGHDSGVQTAEERRDEFEPARVKQQRTTAGQSEVLQPDSDGPCPAV